MINNGAYTFSDNYEHDNPELLYTCESIPTSQTKEEYEKQFLEGCQCITNCLKDKCTCILKSGAYYNTIQEKELQLKQVITIMNKDQPIYECNDSCKCYETTCGHRLVQLGPHKNLSIRKCPEGVKKGLGVFATTNISQGSFICEYAGEIITEKESKIRFRLNKEQNKMNYIFCVTEHFGSNVIKTYIDSSTFGNIGRYINHSCNPNCFLLPIRVNTSVPKICIFSKKNINKGDEITYDYGEGKTNYTRSQRECLCGEVNCRKYLPFSNDLTEET